MNPITQAIEALEEANELLEAGYDVEKQVAAALQALRSMPAEPVERRQSFLRNCHIFTRKEDEGCLFYSDGENRVEAYLDGYLIIPIEEAGEILRSKYATPVVRDAQ